MDKVWWNHQGKVYAYMRTVDSFLDYAFGKWVRVTKLYFHVESVTILENKR